MTKKLTFLLLSIMLMTSVIVEAQTKVFRNQANGNTDSTTPRFDRGGIIETTILTEDFSKFTAGNENDPDHVRLDDADGFISDEYFNTPGWKGSEIYQAGGCAYIGFSEYYQEPGLIITPLINTTGAIYINCRVRCYDPSGDIIGYNILTEDMDLLDANVDFFRATNEWTDISWFTSAGAENTRIYIFSYSRNILIDDIEIVSHALPTPVLKEETNIETDNFTANWESVDDADSYIFKLTAQHTANAEETFYYTNTRFDNVGSNGTTSFPEIPTEMEATIENWHIYMPALINEAIGFTGKYASSEIFGAITSPVLDLSSDNGNITISFKAHADINTELIVSLITSEYGYYDVTNQKTIFIQKEGWNEYSVELENGTNDAYIEITSFGFGNVFFDDLKLSQTIKENEVKTLVIDETEVEDTQYKAYVNKNYINDNLSYQVAARKNVYSASNKIIGTIDSEFTDAKAVSLIKEEISLDETISIGEGDLTSSYVPISNYGSANFSISQQIYTKDDFNKEGGAIKSISFHNKNGNSNTRNINVYMSNTVQDAYRDGHDWVLVNEAELVFSGEFTFGCAEEWTTIELQKPFVYEGKNVALTIYDASDSNLGYGGSHDTFYATATDTLRGLYKTASSKINVYNIEEVYGYDLKTSIYTTPANQYYVNEIKFVFGALPEVEHPNVPQNLSAFAVDARSIALSWTSAQNATSYNVYLGTEKLANVTTTYYLAEGLEPNTNYCFTITALNDEEESEKSAEACAKTLDNVGLEEMHSSLSIYPNPVKNEIYVSFEEEIEEVTIYNIYGQKQFTIDNLQLTMNCLHLNIEHLNPGTYFIKVNGSVKKFIKE